MVHAHCWIYASSCLSEAYDGGTEQDQWGCVPLLLRSQWTRKPESPFGKSNTVLMGNLSTKEGFSVDMFDYRIEVGNIWKHWNYSQYVLQVAK